MSAICILIPDGCKIYIQLCQNILQSKPLECFDQSTLLSYELLANLYEELGTADIARQLKTTIDQILQQSIAVFIQKIEIILQHNSLTNLEPEYLSSILRVLSYFIQQDASISSMQQDYSKCLQLILQTMIFVNNEKVCLMSHKCLRNLFCKQSYPNSLSLIQLKAQFVQQYFSYQSEFIQSIKQQQLQHSDPSLWVENNDNPIISVCLRELCMSFMTLFTYELPQLINVSNAIEIQQCYQQGFLLFLDLLSLFPRSLIMISFDFWGELETLSGQDDEGIKINYQFVLEHALPRLFYVLFSHTMYPQTFDSIEELQEDQEELFQLRDSRFGIFEILELCMEPSFVSMDQSLISANKCLELLANQYHQAIARLNESNGQNYPWQHIEISYYLLTGIMKSIKQLALLPSNTNSTIGQHQNQLNQLLYTFLIQLVAQGIQYFLANQQTMTSNSPSNKYLLLIQESIANYFGSLSFLFTHSLSMSRVDSILIMLALPDFPNSMALYHALLRYCLIFSLHPNKALSLASSKSFYKLLLHGYKSLPSSTSSVHSQIYAQSFREYIRYFTQHYASSYQNLSDETILQLIEAFTRTIFLLLTTSNSSSDSTVCVTIAQDLQMLGQPVIDCLSYALQSLQPFLASTQIIQSLNKDMIQLFYSINSNLVYISQMIRFCDLPMTHSPSSEHYLIPFLTSFWPIFTQLQQTLLSLYQMNPKLFRVDQPPKLLLSPSDSNPNSSSSNPTNNMDNIVSLESIIAKKFEIFGRMIASLQEHIDLQLIQQIINEIFNALDQIYLTTSIPTAALTCTINVFDYLINNTSKVSPNDCLYPFLIQLHSVLLTPMKEKKQLMYELETIDQYCCLMFDVVNHCRMWLYESKLMNQMLEISLLIVQTCYERDPLRNLFKLLNQWFLPKTFGCLHGQRHAAQETSIQPKILQETIEFSHAFILLLIHDLSSGKLHSSLIHTLAEVFSSILVAYNEQGMSSYCQTWLQEALVTNASSSLVNVFSLEWREQLVLMLWRIAVYENRRFKALIQDMYRVCMSEATLDTLLAYTE